MEELPISLFIAVQASGLPGRGRCWSGSLTHHGAKGYAVEGSTLSTRNPVAGKRTETQLFLSTRGERAESMGPGKRGISP